MERLEKNVLYISLALMIVFAALVAYAGLAKGIVLPTCEEHVAPFTKGEVIPKENNQFEVHYVAKMWRFEPAELILPEKADLSVYLSAVDVQHGFEVIGTNMNLMGVPGSVNAAHHVFDKTGEYLVVCHEYCGLNHQNMSGKIRIVTAAEYTQLMKEQTAKVMAVGEQLSADKQCFACHTTDGTEGIGPTFKGIYDRRERMADGTEIVVDDAYLIDAIKNPDKQIVANYDRGSMPPTPLTDEEIEQLMAYLKTLK